MAARTSLKTKRIAPGKYRTVDGRWQVERQDKEWALYALVEGQEPQLIGMFRTSDGALISIETESPGTQSVQEAPTTPATEAKPKRRQRRQEPATA